MVGVYVCTYVHAHVYSVWRLEENFGCGSSVAVNIFFEAGSLAGLKLVKQPDGLAVTPRDSHVLVSPTLTGVTDNYHGV